MDSEKTLLKDRCPRETGGRSKYYAEDLALEILRWRRAQCSYWTCLERSRSALLGLINLVNLLDYQRNLLFLIRIYHQL